MAAMPPRANNFSARFSVGVRLRAINRLSPWHSAGVTVPQGHSLNLVAWPLQAEHQRRYTREDCGPQREQNGDVAWHEDVHGQDDNRATLRSCFNLELILYYVLA